MKTLDTFSKRILVVAVSVSLVLLSLSAFLLTVQRVTAEPKQAANPVMPTIVGLGIDTQKGVGYYMTFPNGTIAVHKSPPLPY